MRKKIVVVEANGDIDSHMPDWSGNHATLCGMDGDDPDPSVRQKIVAEKAAVITCRQCFAIWQVAREYTVDYFAPS